MIFLKNGRSAVADEDTIHLGDTIATFGEALITTQHAGRIRIERS